MSEKTDNICIINAKSGIGTASPQVTQFTHNCSCVKFIVDKDFSACAVVLITNAGGRVSIVAEGESFVKAYDSESGCTNILWYPQSEITCDSGVVVYQIAAYSTDENKSVWYSKEGRLIVSDSIGTTDLSAELIGSSPNLIMQILTLSKSLELGLSDASTDIAANKIMLDQNTEIVNSLNAEFKQYKSSVPKGEENYNSNSSLSQSGKAVAQAIASIVNSAPETLNTLEELAKALGNDPNFATTIMTLLGGKVDKESYEGDQQLLFATDSRCNELLSYVTDVDGSLISHKENVQNPHSVTKEQVGLGRVDNTSDVDKPVSGAAKAELDKKVDKVENFGLTLMEPTIDDEEDSGYSWDKVYFENKPFIPGEDVTRLVEVYSADGADKKFVEKVDGKGLSTNDFTDTDKQTLKDTRSDMDIMIGEITTALERINNKVDKEVGKGLSSNDFTDDYKVRIEDNTYLIGDTGILLTDTTDTLVDAINEIYNDIHQTPIITIPTTLESNQQYNFGEVESLSLTFPTVANDGDVIYLTFYSGATPTTLTIDTTNTCDIEVIPEANTGYEIFGKYNGSIWIVNYSEYTVSEV